jgi:hypothetical protein
MAEDDRTDDGRALPSTNHPLNGPTRPLAKPVVAVLAMISWLRYDT